MKFNLNGSFNLIQRADGCQRQVAVWNKTCTDKSTWERLCNGEIIYDYFEENEEIWLSTGNGAWNEEEYHDGIKHSITNSVVSNGNITVCVGRYTSRSYTRT